MKVAIVAPYYHPHPGGVEVYASNMARRLKAQGWEVFVITSGKKQAEVSESTIDGVKVYRLGYRFKLSNTPIGFSWRRDIERILEREKPDVINGHTPVPYLADLVERVRGTIPFVLTYHNDLVKERFPHNILAKLTHLFLIASTLRRANRIVVTSAYYADMSRYLRPYKSKMSVVPPGVDKELFNCDVDGTEVRKRYGDRPIILFVGSIEKSQDYKGLDNLIACLPRIAKTIGDTQLIVVGEGDAKARYKQLATELGVADRVDFVGYKTQAELAVYNAAADVQVLPSTNSTEGFGMVLIEAGACGTPVIGTKVGGIPFAIDDGISGLLVPPRNQAALTEAIVKVLSDTDLAKQLGEGGAARTKALFDWSELAEQTAQALAIAMKPIIVQVAGYYPPHLGGMEKVAKILSEQMALRDYDTRVLTSAVAATGPALPRPNLSVSRFKAFEFAHTPIAPGFIPAILRVPKQAVIHLHLAQAFYPELVWLASKMRGIPYIVHFHLDLMPSGVFGKLFLLYKAVIIRKVIRDAQRVVVFSAEQQAFICNSYGVPAHRVTVIPNGVDESFFAKPHTYGRQATFNLLYVGRLSAQKCVDRLVGMMAVLKTPARLTIVGDGDMRATLEQQAKTLGLTNVSFAGHKTAAEIRDYFAKADVFAIASDREGMPLVVLEAMAAGLPIVGSNVTGMRELVNGVGLLVNDPSPQSFAAALDELLADMTRLKDLAGSSIDAARTYTWTRVTNDFEKVYTEVAQ
jgi:glycosyltransferase involved in cell wall biosynthesis